jgi:hypothetical protein
MFHRFSDAHLQLHLSKSKLHQANVEKQAASIAAASAYNPEQTSSSDSESSASTVTKVRAAAAPHRRHFVTSGRMYSDMGDDRDCDEGRWRDLPPEESRWQHDRFLDVALDTKKLTDDYASRWRKSEMMNADRSDSFSSAGVFRRGSKRSLEDEDSVDAGGRSKTRIKGVAIPFTY